MFGHSVKRLPLIEKNQRIHQNIDGFKIEQGDLDCNGDCNPGSVNAPLGPVNDGDAANISVLRQICPFKTNIISLQENMSTRQCGGAAGSNSQGQHWTRHLACTCTTTSGRNVSRWREWLLPGTHVSCGYARSAQVDNACVTDEKRI